MYADSVYYHEIYKGAAIPEESLEKHLKLASRHIDTLTYNRIRSIESLTDFQQNVIREVCCEMADFEYENADILNSILQSYSINGVSMTFGDGLNVKIINGTAVRYDAYRYLCQTGLCCRLLR